MGAYENPPIIKVPNFAEIFNRNFMPGLKAGIAKQEKREALEAQQQAAIRKQQVEEAKQRKIAEGKSLEYTEKFQEKISKIKGGSLQQGLQQEASSMTDAFYKNENDYANGVIDFDTYSAKRLGLNSAIDTMSSFGNSMSEFEKSLEKIDISNYQDNEKLIGLIAAWKQGKLVPSYDEENGSVELVYEVDGKIIDVDETWLTNPESWTVNQKFDANTFLSEASDSIADQVFDSQVQTTEGDVTSTVVTKVWRPGYENEEKRFQTFLNSGAVNNLSDSDLGSYYMDNLAGSVSSEDIDLKNTLNKYKLTEEQKSKISAAIDSGEFIREVDGADAGKVIRDFAKIKLAKQAVAMANEKSPEGLVEESTKISETKPTVKEKAIKQGINDYLENPITQEEFNNVIQPSIQYMMKTGEGSNKESEKRLVDLMNSKGFTFKQPTSDSAGEKYTGARFIDNATKKEVFIYFEDDFLDVESKIKQAKNIKNTGDNTNEPVVFDGSN